MKKNVTLTSILFIMISINAQPDLKNILHSGPWNFTPNIENREYWKKLRNATACKVIVKRADSLLEQKILAPPVESYMEFYTNGNRMRYERKYVKFRGSVTVLSLAACLTNKPKYVKKLEGVLSEFCKMKCWVLPAHDRKKKNINGKQIDIDLVSSNVGWQLSIVVNLLRPVLKPGIIKMVQEQVLLKVVDPFDAMVSGKRSKNWWINGKNNWNSVCLANVAGTILAANIDQARRVRLLQQVIKYSNNYLKGFAKDGYCSEGTSYWSYGFGHYLILSVILYQATDGKLNLMERPAAKLPAEYPDKIQIARNVCPAFADSYYNGKISRTWLGVRDYLWGIPSQDWNNLKLSSRNSLITFLLIASIPKPNKPLQAAKSQLTSYSIFPDAGIVIVRPGEISSCRLAAAFKGGSNFEFHNHNDVGSYSLTVDGKLPIVGDPGLEHYSRRTFSKKRYESNLINSYGHCVPRIDGNLQSNGKGTYAPILEKTFTLEGALVKIDMAPAYPEVKNIVTLERAFAYRRDNSGSFSVTDVGAFKEPVEFETAIITFGKYKQESPNKIIISYQGQKVEATINTRGVPFSLSSEEIKEDIRWNVNPQRIAVKLMKKTKKAFIEITFKPL